MLDYDTNSRIQATREHADRLADEISRSRPLNPEEPGKVARLGSALVTRVGRVRRHRHAPAYQA